MPRPVIVELSEPRASVEAQAVDLSFQIVNQHFESSIGPALDAAHLFVRQVVPLECLLRPGEQTFAVLAIGHGPAHDPLHGLFRHHFLWDVALPRMNSPTEDSSRLFAPTASAKSAELPPPSAHGARPIAVATRYIV